METMMKRNILAAAIGAALALGATSTFAESSSVPGGAGASTQANLNFSLTIPSFLRLQVGSAGSVDTIDFSPAIADLATSPSTIVAGSAGDLGGGKVTVKLQGNPGTATATLTYRTTVAALSDGGTNSVPWSTIKVAYTVVPHPAALADGSGSDQTVTTVTTTGGVFNESGTWTYTWDDGGTIYPAGTYTGRVAYKLAAP
jgi:hypothetical protein